MDLRSAARSLHRCGLALLALGVVQLVSFAYFAAALSIAGGGLLVDFTFSEDALRARLLGTTPGCMCRKPPVQGSRAAYTRDCCSPLYAFGVMIGVIVLSVLQLIQSITLAVEFGPYIYSSYSYYYPYDGSRFSLPMFIYNTSIVGAVCCVAQLITASAVLAQLVKLQRQAAVGMPGSVKLLTCCGCCDGGQGCCGDVVDQEAASAAQPVHHSHMAVAGYPPGYFDGLPAASPQTGYGTQALTTGTKTTDALYSGAGSGFGAGDLRAPLVA